jgi:hypothetical protein
MSRNSKKASNMIQKLNGDPKAHPTNTHVTANQVAKQLLMNGKSNTRTKEVKLDLNNGLPRWIIQ